MSEPEYTEGIRFARRFLGTRGMRLSELDKVAIEAAWKGMTYGQISIDKNVNCNTLRNFTAPALWRKLSKASDQKVSKRTYKEFVLASLQEKEDIEKTEEVPVKLADTKTSDLGILPLNVIDFEQAISAIRKQVNHQGSELSTVEEVVLEAAWKDVTYEQLGKARGINPNTLKSYASGRLWKSLSALLNRKVRKKSFRRVLTEAIESEQLTGDELPAPRRGSEDDGERTVETVSTVGAKLPDTSKFSGRVNELKDLKNLIASYPCILLIGTQGIGKKSLVSMLIQTQEMPCSKVLWKPLHHKPNVERLETELLELLDSSNSSQSLISHLRKNRHLLVLDGLDSILEQQGDLRTIDSRYVSLVRRIVEETPSQVICISEEPIEDFDILVLRGDAIAYTLRGLKASDAEHMFDNDFGINVKEVVESVGGNPLLLKQIAAWSKESVQIDPSLVNRATVQRGVVKNWHEQVLVSDYLSDLDRKLLDAIAQSENGIPYSQLLTQYPDAAHRISRLLAMGLASQKMRESGTSSIEVNFFFRKHLLARS